MRTQKEPHKKQNKAFYNQVCFVNKFVYHLYIIFSLKYSSIDPENIFYISIHILKQNPRLKACITFDI